MTSHRQYALGAAEALRAEQHLGSAPIADLVAALEDVPGVHVAVLSKTDGNHHGMRATDPARGVTVLAAAATPNPIRLRSTLAHELAHHVFGDPTPTTWSEKTFEEDRATEFARHLLIPVSGLEEVLGEPGVSDVDEALLSRLVKRFMVSPQMATIQLRNSGFVGHEVASRYMELTTPTLATRYGWGEIYSRWSADSRVVRPPRRIVAAAINAYIGGDATIETIANLRDVSSDIVRTELEQAKIKPVARKEPEQVQVDFDWGTLDDSDAGRA